MLTIPKTTEFGPKPYLAVRLPVTIPSPRR